VKTAIGILIVVAHLAAFVWIAGKSRGADFSIEAPVPTPGDLRDGRRGLVHEVWTRTYRGGYTRTIGATQLLGPFQDPAHPRCSGRVVLGQRMLDDGKASADTIAGVTKQMIDRELRGTDIFPIGKYKRVTSLALAWVKSEPTLRERRMLGKAGAPDGFVRAKATVAFDRVDVPVLVALVPQRPDAPGKPLSFKIVAEADLDFDNRALQWFSDKVGADDIATKIAREQIDDVLVTTFAPPPPFTLSEGQTLQFTYCDEPAEIVDGAYGALPFAVAITGVPGAPNALPPTFPRGERLPPPAGTLLAIDLDVDALNAMLYELWRTSWLDKRLADVGLDRRFNTDPIVTEYLSIRISPLHLALPPVLSPGADASLRLAADARVAIEDGSEKPTIGQVYGALDLRFARGPGTELPTLVDLGDLDLSCERDPWTLVPCYGDLVAALRDRGQEFHGALSEAFAGLLADIFVDRRIGAEGLPVDIVIARAVPTLAGGGTLHLQLEGKLAPAP
jgi:hypothetical protein